MNKLVETVFEGVKSGKIQKDIAAKLLKVIKLESNQLKQRGKDIAIIGIDAMLPMAKDIRQFRHNLKNKVDCVTSFPENRRKDSNWLVPHLTDGNTSSVKYNKGGYIKHIDKFDHKFFQISPAEARLMDSSQKLFLQTAWRALEDAGYGVKLSGSNTGVYVGYNKWPAYAYCISRYDMSAVSMALSGNLSSIIAGRLSYMMDFKGPSMVIDTACSSSMVAFYEACQAIRNGDCDYAIAGGINIELLPCKGAYDLGIESSSNKTKSFSENADGTVWGEGVAAVLLKPLDRALKDHDNIYAVIKGIASNQDGTSVSLTAPNMLSQKALYIKAWEDAGINPETISFIEAHGTATKLGDPIEIDGLTRAFLRYTGKKQFCAISTVKTNIGHLNAASGIVGIIKAALSLKYREIYPMIHFTSPNKTIDFVNSPFYINDDLHSYTSEETPMRCGVSSFGFSGANCHIVLEEAPGYMDAVEESEKPQILTLSAKSMEALRNLLYEYKEYMCSDYIPPFKDICYTSNIGRGYFDYRFVFVVKGKEDFLQKLYSLDIEKIKENSIFSDKLEAFGQIDRNTMPTVKHIYDSFQKAGGGKITKEFLYQVGLLYLSGNGADWDVIYGNELQNRVSIPTYPFEESRNWYECTSSANLIAKDCKVENNRNTIKEVVLYGREDEVYSTLEKQIAKVFGNVLGYEKVGIRDDYFDLGGDSIYSSVIANRISEIIGVKFNMTDLFSNANIEALAQYIQSNYLKDNRQTNVYAPIVPAKKADFYPLSPAQKRIYILSQLNKSYLSYNQPSARMIDGVFDVTKCETIFKKLVKRHEAFRTQFKMREGEPCQIILPEVDFKVEYFDMTGKEPEDIEVLNVKKAFIRPFDLVHAPLLRVGLIKLKEKKHILIYDIHHIISDGTTESIISTEFIKLYNNLELKNIEVQYKDYVIWYNDLLKTDEVKRQQTYWTKKLSDKLPKLNLSYDYTRPSVKSFEGNTIDFKISTEMTDQLRDLSKKTGTTMYMVLLAAYYVFLYKHTGQEDIVVGTPIAGRIHKNLENVIGIFINMLAMRNFPNKHLTFTQHLKKIKETAIEAFENQDYPFEEIVEKLKIERDYSRNPVFDTMFVLQNILQSDSTVEGINFKNHIIDSGISKLDLTLTAYERENYLEFSFEYCTKLFKPETIKRYVEHYINILEDILSNPDKELKEIKMISQKEINRILYDFNNTNRNDKDIKTIHQIFEEQVERTPSAIALVIDGKELTYRELNDKSNRLARKLREEGVGRNCIVGLLVDRSKELFIGILGIIKAGGSYLPIDSEYPSNRIQYMLEDARVNVILTKQNIKRDFNFEGIILNLDEGVAYSNEVANLKNINERNDLLYVLYTSGSTGKPKGVMIEHGSVYNFIMGLSEYIDFNEGKSILVLTTISFDIFVVESLLPLTKGMKLIVALEDQQKHPKLIKQLIMSYDVDILQATPSRMQLILSDKSDEGCFMGLRVILLGGEALHNDIKEKLSLVTKAKLFNLYGPTETTVYSAIKYLEDDSEITIGKPLANTRMYIMNENKQLQPIGVNGELYIAGAGLARGYVNNEERTQESFIPDPLFIGEKMYKTGDAAMWLASGEIKFIGRIDNQVKIRGYRIELEEIENHLNTCPYIEQAAVVVKTDPDQNNRLYAYVVSKDEIKVSKIRKYLLNYLPDYMIPNSFVQIDQLPTTANGKIDRTTLVSLESELITGVTYLEPSNEIEERIHSVWKKVLELDKIGIHDDFFELGGNSLLAVKLEVEMENIGYPISGPDIFLHKTISELSSLFLSTDINKNPKVISLPMIKESEYNHVMGKETILLDGIEPFNDIFYRNCFYNSAFPIAIWFKKEIKSFLMNDVLIYHHCTEELNLALTTDYKTCRTLEDIMKEEGLQIKTKIICEDIISDILTSLSSHKPVIVWVDCFYEPIRVDTYQKKHITHTILVYGYDYSTETFHIIEHKHRDNLSYDKRQLHKDDLIKAYHGFLENFNQDMNRESFYEFRSIANKNIEKDYQKEFLYNLSCNKDEIERGLKEFKVFTQRFELAINHKDDIDKQMDVILHNMNEIINTKKVEKYKLEILRLTNTKPMLILEEIIENLVFIRNICAKYVFSRSYHISMFRDCHFRLMKIYELEYDYLESVLYTKS